MPKFKKVANVNDLKSGEMKVVEVNGEEICLSRVDDQFFAISNTCLHQSGPLGEGTLDGGVVTCPWHGWKYNVKTGVSPVVPTVKVDTFEVKVEGEDILVSTEPKE